MQRGGSLTYARLAAETTGLGKGRFQEGHEIPPTLVPKIPQEMIGKSLSSEEAAGVLDLLSSRSGKA